MILFNLYSSSFDSIPFIFIFLISVSDIILSFSIFYSGELLEAITLSIYWCLLPSLFFVIYSGRRGFFIFFRTLFLSFIYFSFSSASNLSFSFLASIDSVLALFFEYYIYTLFPYYFDFCRISLSSKILFSYFFLV